MTKNESTALPRIFLIRHGDTDWSDSHQHTGHTDIPLNIKGETHARELSSRLEGESFTRVFTSPLSRARRTCELSGFSEHAEIDSDLIEWDYGDYEGLRSDEIHRIRPDWELFRDGAPHGESPEQAASRADRFLNKVRGIEGTIAAFSSGHIIRMIGARWLNLPPETGRFFYTATASISIIGYEHNRDQPVLLLWNSTA